MISLNGGPRGRASLCAVTLLLLVCGHSRVTAQTDQAAVRATAPHESAARHITGYLAGKEPDFLDILPPYPAFDSIEDQMDVATLRQWQQPGDSARWRVANADVRISYDRFAESFGMDIDQARTPLLDHLLNRVERDVQAVTSSAKNFYNRPRPFQRFQMEHVCGAEKAPAPEVPLKGGSSYPSGHTSFGRSAVLVLAEVAPERAQQLLARGREYGESRVVCAVHYPSDVAGGELVATAVVTLLQANPEFREDLACAQQEHAAVLKPGTQLSPACQTRKAQLVQP